MRKQAERENKKIGNRINFLKKEEDSAEKKVMKKQKELETLMDVIARRQADHEKVLIVRSRKKLKGKPESKR